LTQKIDPSFLESQLSFDYSSKSRGWQCWLLGTDKGTLAMTSHRSMTYRPDPTPRTKAVSSETVASHGYKSPAGRPDCFRT